MSLQKGKHSGAGQIPPQQRPQYPAAQAYGAPPPATFQQYILSNRTPQDTSRVGDGGYGGQGAHGNPVYAAPGQNNNQNTMRAAMPPNPSSTPPGQQQQQPQMSAELSKGPQHLQQSLAGGSHSYQYLAQHQRAQQPQYLPRNPINQRMQQNHRPVAPNSMPQSQLGYSPQMPQMYANVMGPGMSANQPAVFQQYIQYPQGARPYYAGQQAVIPFYLPYPQGQQNAMIYNSQMPLMRGALNQQQNAQHVMAAAAPATAAPPHQQQPQQQPPQPQQQQQQQQQQQVPPQMAPAPMQPVQPMPPREQSTSQGRRKNAIKIIDPNSGKDVLEEMYESSPSNAATPPRSGESSARQTPQPSPADVVAEFAAKVAIAAGEVSKQEDPSPSSVSEPSRVASVSPAASNGPHEEPKHNNKMTWVAPQILAAAAAAASAASAPPPEPKEVTPPPPAPVVIPAPQAPAVATAAPEVKEAPAWEAKQQQRPPKQISESVAPEPTEKKPTSSEPEEGRNNQWRQPARKPSQKEAAAKEAPPPPPPEAPVATPKAPEPPAAEPVVVIAVAEEEAAVVVAEPQLAPSNPKTAPTTSSDQTPAASKDEPKMVTVEDNLVAAKNEENSRIAAESGEPAAGPGSNNPTVIEQQLPDETSKIVYSDDQWSPFNMDGKKKYNRDFLMQFQSDPQSLKRPEDLPKLEVVIDKGRPTTTRPLGNLSRTDAGNLLMPNFLNQTQRGGSLLRNKSSQQGKPKPTKVVLNLSLNEDIKLNETENAWKPGVLDHKPKTGDEEAEKEDLLKKMRSILNKLTPQKFDLLVEQVKKMNINSEDKLSGVIELVFEKAVDEPGFSETYAKLCQTLSKSLSVVQNRDNDNKGADGKPQQIIDHVAFKKKLLGRCQEEFQKEKQLTSTFTAERDAKLKEMELADGAKCKEVEMQLEELERKMRKKYVGVNRFIGELYRINLLTGTIMTQCIAKLIDNRSEESLECLCKLLTTIGHDLETRVEKDKKGATRPPQNLEPQIKIMKDIVKSRATSSRIRFMLQDVLDLRDDNWRPRRLDSAPRTMDAIAKEAEQEHMAINMHQQTPMRGGKDDRGDRNKRGGRGGVSDDGWMVSGGGRMPSSSNRAPLDSNKLKVKQQDGGDVSLGSRNFFSSWGKGSNSSNVKAKPEPELSVPQTNNQFMLLSESEKPMSAMAPPAHDKVRKSRDVNLVSKNSSSDGSVINRHSRSNSRESSLQRMEKSTEKKEKEAAMLSADDLEHKSKLLLDEYISSGNVNELILTARNEVNPAQYKEFLDTWVNLALEWSPGKRAKTAAAMLVLQREAVFTPSVLQLSLAEVLAVAPDMIIDIPKTYQYLAELFVPQLSSTSISLAALSESLLANCDKAGACKMLVECLHLLQKEVGPSWIQTQWRSSNLNWNNYVTSDVQKFLTDNQLTYLSESSKESVGDPAMRSKSELMSPQEMQERLVKLMSSMGFDEVSNYIDVNVGKVIRSPKYIRALMTTICEVSCNKTGELHKLNEDTLNKFSRLIVLYVDNSPELELQALYAIQAFVTRLQHPPSLLRSILTNLLEESVLSKDAIRAWIKSDDQAEQGGRGVALKSINQFITWLEEPEDESPEEAP